MRERERTELRRFARIGLLVGVGILVGGVIAFRNAGEGTLQAIGLIGFFSTFAVIHGLDERAKRRRKRRQ
jgi:hypothetical protein